MRLRLIHLCFSQGIAELSDMIIERLQAFRRRSNVLPKRMIIFRDGVSEVRTGFRRIYHLLTQQKQRPKEENQGNCDWPL